MAIIRDNTSTATTTTSTTTVSWSHTVNTVSGNRALIVSATANDTSGGTANLSAQYNGVAMTKLSQENQGSAIVHAVFYTIDPPTGTNTVRLDVSGYSGTSNISGTASSFYNVAQTETFLTPIKTNGASVTGTGTLSPIEAYASLGLVLMTIGARNAGTLLDISPTTGYTEIAEATAGTNLKSFVSTKIGTSFSESGGGTWNGTIYGMYYNAIAFVMKEYVAPATAKTFIVTSGTTFPVPTDWDNSNNQIECIGGGGYGSGGSGGAGGGGGGGAYALKSNVSLTKGETVAHQIGASTSSNATYVESAHTRLGGTSLATSIVGAEGGQGRNVGFSSPGDGGRAAASIGDTKYSGGNGASYVIGTSGGGGGGAAGPSGAGANGSGVNGGNAGGGLGGAGGGSQVDGGDGTEFNGTHGSGGGGGSTTSYNTPAANGGSYGGAGGGIWGGARGAGKSGIMVIQYTPLIPDKRQVIIIT